jgi:hypothetical protein
MRCKMRLLEGGSLIWDTETNAPTVVNGRWQTGLDLSSADFLMNCLNRRNQANKADPETV